jgi:hypothetical protein
MTRLIDNIKKKLSAAWGKSVPALPIVVPEPMSTIETVLTAAEAGDTGELRKLMASSGAALFQSSRRGDSVSVEAALYIVNNASPAAFDLLMSQPEVDTLAKKIYLRNAAYHNKPELAEILLKDPAIGDKEEVQKLFNSEYVLHNFAEERATLGGLLVKYGANIGAAQERIEKDSEVRKVEETEHAKALQKRLKNLGAAL